MTESYAGVAIVGIAAQLPSGRFADRDLDYPGFFDFLLQRGEAYQPIPQERFNVQYLLGEAPGRVITNIGAFLKEIHEIDYMEFGITAKDAHLMPLSTRKLLEVSFLSLQDSGIDYRGKNVGCYMSGVAFDAFSLSGHDDVEAKGSFAYGPAMLANRVSYHLDLRGPSVPIDTACSSSLYATHIAVQALLSGECEAAIVGGSQINHRFTEWLSYTQGSLLAFDGKCKPFDASANGFGRGEGVVTIVLKRLESAVRDHDRVYATILGTGVNSSGALVPANAPAAHAQRDAMLRAFSQARREPREVDFLELHATGTSQGDPTEANWVGESFKRDDDLVIGSVKGNIGHLEITSFLASLCKVCGILDRETIPPNVNLKIPNPAIKWSDFRLRVPLEQVPLKCRSGNGRSLIAMTSSGIGGANGHAVIEGPPSPDPPTPFWMRGTDIPVLLIAAALSPRSTAVLGEALLDTANDSAEIASLARILGRRARSMTWRSFAVAGLAQSPQAVFSKPVIVPKIRPPIVFVFSGQGTQHFHMGRELFRTCAPFRESILELDHVYASVVGSSLVESTGLFGVSEAFPTDRLGDPWPIAITLPALTMLQLALVDALAVAGVQPDVVVGHSAGETAVLSASGAASKYVALKLAIARGRALALLEDAEGTMAAVNCSPKQAQEIIDELKAEIGDGVLEVGCFNTASAVTLSGQRTHIDLAVAKATAAGIFARRLKTRIPVHSGMMELCRAELERLLTDIFPESVDACIPKIATYSTVTGGLYNGPLDTSYYWDGTLKPVLFQDAIEAILLRYKGATFVEIGPHPVLTGYLRAMAEGFENVTVTCTLRRARMPTPGSEVSEFLAALGSIVTAGHNCVDFDALYGSAGWYTGELPKYPFAKKSVPWVIPTPEIARQRQRRNGPLNYAQLSVNARTHPELADHVVKGEPIMPASGFIEMALEFGATELYDISFHRVLALSPERPTPLNVELNGTAWSVNSASNADNYDSWPIQYNRRHATGFLSKEPTQDLDMRTLDIGSIRASMKPVKIGEVYSGIAHFLGYGPLYRRIQECHTATRADGTVEALVKVKGRDVDLPNIDDFVFHPAILDAAIHIVAHPMMTGNHDKDLYHLPDKVASLRTSSRLRAQPFPESVFALATSVRWSPESITFNVTITDHTGVLLCIIDELEVARHGLSRAAVHKRYDVVYEPTGLVLPVHGEESSNYTIQKSSEASDGDDSSTPAPSPDSLSTAGSDLCCDKEPSLIIEYVRTEEMKIHARLPMLESLQNVSLLFVAQDGIHGDAALGFTRSLRKEYPSWTVRVIVFDSSLTRSQQLCCSRTLARLSHPFLEMWVDEDGVVHAPRIELSPGPSDHIPFDTGRPWTLEARAVAHKHLPQTLQDRSVVHVSAVHRDSGHVWAFVGTLHGSSTQVIGMSTSPITSHLEVHSRCVVECDDDLNPSPYSSRSILAPALAALAVDPPSFTEPSRIHGRRVLVFSSSDMDIHDEIHRILSGLGVNSALITSLTTGALKTFYTRKPYIVISGTQNRDEMAVLRALLPTEGRAFFWNDLEGGIARVMENSPWLVGDAVRAALHYSRQATHPHLEYTPILELEELQTARSLGTARPSSLFDPNKAYLLVGGIGSLGMHISLWMYENGARNIIVTSRSGPEKFQKRSDFIAQRILDYLLSRQELTLHARAADATCAKDLMSILEDISTPLGGAFILSGMLNDRPFASHTEESFDSVFPPKVGAFSTLASVVDIDSLDFCIPFSSVSGMFGNPGQTSYAAANTALCGMVRRYRNAFSMVCPIILDSSILTLTDDAYTSRVRHITQWGMTARELCGYIGDGIRKLQEEEPVWQYIPDFDWRVVRDNIGPSQLYDHLVPPEEDESTEPKDSDKPSLVEVVCRVLDLQEAEISVDVPLTSYGLDSLSASSLSYALRSHVSVSQLQLLADLTIANLQTKMEKDAARASQVELSPHSSTNKPAPTSEKEALVATRVEEMQSLFKELTATMSADSSRQDASTSVSRISRAVLVTGTTGSLGSHVLAELLALAEYDKVVALVRPNGQGSTTRERQVTAFTDRGLDVTLLDSPKFVLFDCPFEGERLGLDPAVYDQLRTSVSHIVHIGWPVNFELPLQAFKDALCAMRDLLNLATEALEFGPVSVLYGSSSGIFRNYSDLIPPTEKPLDATVAVGHGYSESKWVAEQLAQVAAERTSLKMTAVRIGQLTGSATGVWNSSEWLPAMISASTALGCLPGGHGPVSWLPVQAAASAIIELVGDMESSHTIVHLRHPRPVSWMEIMSHFSAILHLPTIDYSTWISQLSTLHQRPDIQHARYANAAMGLMDVLQSRQSTSEVTELPVTENNGLSILMGSGDSSLRCSVLRNSSLKQLSLEDVASWVEYWRRVGSLPSE